VDLLLIGGVSGSGKSVALAAFEDAGYYTVNNLPVPLIVETADYLANSGQQRVAIALDVKTGPGLPGLADAMAALGTRGWSVRFIYLDATVETLVKRFSETRRRHPFSSDDRTLTEAIEYERDLVADARHLGMTFDTSEIAPAALRAWIKDFVSVDASKLTLQLESFGFKHGLPLDADLVFDARCLPNPHYDPALSPLTGRHADVVAFLDLDAEMLAPRYRAAEQAMTLLVRAARLVGGRAGGGRLVVQTFLPRHEVLQAVLHADPSRLAKVETERRQLLGLPPFSALAAVSGAGAIDFASASGLESSADGDVVLLRADSWDRLGRALESTPRPKGSRLRIAVDPPR